MFWHSRWVIDNIWHFVISVIMDDFYKKSCVLVAHCNVITNDGTQIIEVQKVNTNYTVET